jgi:hypothetical protein
MQRLRQNLTQALIAEVFGCSQPTDLRWIARLAPLITTVLAACADQRAERDLRSTVRVDGFLAPIGDRRENTFTAGSEGTNRVIKTIARDAYGFRNPTNQRLRTRTVTTPTSPRTPQPRLTSKSQRHAERRPAGYGHCAIQTSALSTNQFTIFYASSTFRSITIGQIPQPQNG